MPLGDGLLPVPGEDDLALLGDLERAVDRAGRLGQHGPAGRAAAPAEGAAAAVEQGQPDAVGRGPGGQPGLGVEEAQGGAGRAELLGRVGVAEHGLEPPAAGCQPLRDLGQREHAGQHVGRVGQVGRALEQRHHVEHGRPAAGRGVAGQFVHGGDVGGRSGKADHVAAARVHAVPVLHPGHRAERGQHLLGRRGQRGRGLGAGQAGAVLGAGRAGGAELGQRPGVHLAVLPDLQASQVEAERLCLPDEMLQLAAGLLNGPGRGQRLLDRAQVGEELGRPGVG